jgi:NAD-dependent deacetylase
VPTFRDSGGLWEGHRVEDVATPEAFVRDPGRVLRFYDARRRAVASASPNVAHRALAGLEAVLGDSVLVVTQNVDDLHERAGTRNLVHMHGELRRALCTGCASRPVWRRAPASRGSGAEPRWGRAPASRGSGAEPQWEGDLVDLPACPVCGERMLRPDVVWFGELPYELDRIEDAIIQADVFVSIGTSGAVYPAAGYGALAAAFGARTVELNLEPSDAAVPFDESRAGRATDIVPVWVDEMLATR